MKEVRAYYKQSNPLLVTVQGECASSLCNIKTTEREKRNAAMIRIIIIKNVFFQSVFIRTFICFENIIYQKLIQAKRQLHQKLESGNLY